MQHVVNARSIEIGNSGDAPLINELEVSREGLNGSGHPIATRPPQLNEILRRGQRDKQPSVIPQHAPKFTRIHPRRDRQNN
jgi:hypothetical protein